MTGEPPQKRSGLSLYADLLGPASTGATIASAPVKYDINSTDKDTESAAAQKKKDALLKFQPIKRPQAQSKKIAKPISSSASAHKLSSSITSSSDKPFLNSTPQQPPHFQSSNFEDWIGDDEDDFGYQGRQKQQRKNKKKKKNQTRLWDWDDIYDPTFPNVHADYKGSDEQAREIRDWKARLYHHQLKEARRSHTKVAAANDGERRMARTMNPMFAPPPEFNFAPPNFNEKPTAGQSEVDIDVDDGRHPSPQAPIQQSGMRSPPASFIQTATRDISGDEAHLRRTTLSDSTCPQNQPIPAPNTAPPGSASPNPIDLEAKRAEAQAKIAAFKAKLGKPPMSKQSPLPNASNIGTANSPGIVQLTSQSPPPPPPPPPETLPPPKVPSTTISRAPVRYELPMAAISPSDTYEPVISGTDDQKETSPEHDRPRPNRSGQKGFAERLLMKYGWEKGQGLGAKGEGITTAIIAKAEKRKKRSDAEGGGFTAPANMGTIVGGKRRKVINQDSEDDGRDNKTSEVIKIVGMLDGLDVAREIEDHNMMQQIGDEMASKYGNIERLFIWQREAGGNDEVFVKFTSGLSALRAVNAVDGMEFAGNNVHARFFDAEKFDRGDYT